MSIRNRLSRWRNHTRIRTQLSLIGGAVLVLACGLLILYSYLSQKQANEQHETAAMERVIALEGQNLQEYVDDLSSFSLHMRNDFAFLSYLSGDITSDYSAQQYIENMLRQDFYSRQDLIWMELYLIQSRQLLRIDNAGKRVLITAGPTVEKIDPVRFISNFSSGKMGFALADECARRGAQVTLVTGPVAINARQPGVERIDVVSADDMCKAVARHMADAQVVILCAAVADYKVAVMSEKKIKREKDEAPVLQLVKNPDIARMVGEQKRPGQVTVGFALETDNEEVNALGKMERKKLDMIVLNSLRDKGAGFQTHTNRVTIYHRNGDVIAGECKAKTEVAADIVEEIVKMLK